MTTPMRGGCRKGINNALKSCIFNGDWAAEPLDRSCPDMIIEGSPVENVARVPPGLRVTKLCIDWERL